MAYRGGHGGGQKVQKVLVQPINLIFRYLQNKSRIQIWLYENVNLRIEGCIIGIIHVLIIKIVLFLTENIVLSILYLRF